MAQSPDSQGLLWDELPVSGRLMRTMSLWYSVLFSNRNCRRRNCSGISCVEPVEARLLLTAGTLDTSFSDDGILVDQFQDGALQVDGKLVLVGQTYLGPTGYYSPTSKEVVLRRFNVDGTIDTSFGTDGTVKPALMTVASMAVRSDGKILVTGTVGSGATAEGAIARFDATGAIDNTFDGDGVRASLAVALGSIVIQTDDRMLVQGSGKLYRFAADGSFDNTFSGDGELISPTTLCIAG